MIHWLKRLASSIQNAAPGKLRLYADATDNTFKVKDEFGNVKTLGNGIAGIALLSSAGLTDTYRITFDDGDTFDFDVENGRSILGVTLHVTNGLTKTYRITYNAGAPFDFDVHDGRGITSITAPLTPGQPGATDTYTINYNDGTTSTFAVYNGEDGLDGIGQPANAVPTTIIPDAAAAIGTQTQRFALQDHTHAIAAATAVGLDANTANAEGTSASFARADHTHAIDTAIPVPVGADNAAGSASTLARSDHRHRGVASISVNGGPGQIGDVGLTIATHSTEAATPIAVNGTASAGDNSSRFSMQGHVHTLVAGGFPEKVGASGSSGSGTTVALSNHVHEGVSSISPIPIQAGIAGIAVDTTKGDVLIRNTDLGSVAVSTHVAAADPHPQYTTTAEAAAAAPVQSVNGQTGAVSLTIPAPKLQAKLTTLFASPANSTAVTVVLSLTIPANYMTAGFQLDLDLECTQSQSAAVTNVLGFIYVNGAALCSASVAGGTAAQTNRSARIKGGVMWNGSGFLGNVTVGVSGVIPVGGANVTGIAAAVGSAHTIDIRVQTSTANAANIIRALAGAIKEV